MSFNGIKGNMIGNEGIQSLSEALQYNTTLIELYLSG